jgi:hypothetical protein
LQEPKRFMEMKKFLMFGVKQDMMRKKNIRRSSKTTSLGMTPHPRLHSSTMRFPIPNLFFNFSTMIIVYILEITSFFFAFLFLWLFFQFFL